ncbi:MAG: hypothetical protein ABI868_03100 [Acidobacteriota bacterium]
MPDRPPRLPWPVWTSAAATTAVVIGSVWDISWHVSIGRDTFWTPPHLLIQLCAAIGGLTAIHLIVRTTWGDDDIARAESVRVFGLRAPLGAFICGWGALAMLTSAPFDNWSHEAYGLDVTVVSPPHMMLALGAVGVIYGGFILTIAERNRAPAALSDRIDTLFILIVGVLMVGSQAELIEYSDKAFMHSAIFYRAFVVAFPMQLMLVRSLSSRRWACSAAAGVYMALSMLQEWVLPMFPAEQKLGPVFQRVTYMVPVGFPALILAPAIALDLLWPRLQRLNRWAAAALAGLVFLTVLLAVQWPFADFLTSPWSRNRLFGTHYQMYMVDPGTPFSRGEFIAYEATRAGFWAGMAIAAATAMMTSRAGLAAGAWMRRVQR